VVRNLGGILLLLGILGFFYASAQLADLTPVPQGLDISAGLEYPAGRWELVRYACAAVGAFGMLMALFPRGR
jgi:hypothetical protein